MRFYGKAECAANSILEAFRNPARLPEALAPAFIRRKDDVPCRAWSWSNQLIAALHGHSDSRGYRQWAKVGRHVRKGEKSFQILAPVTCKKMATNPDTGQTVERVAVVGFRSANVFGLRQTEGEPLPPADPAVEQWVASLPLLDVAREWGLTVEAYSGRNGSALGKYRLGHSIAVGVENLSTWSHELMHAADDRLGNLKERGQHWRSEIVAELGGAVLLSVLGHPTDADLGGCWEYVASYAREAKLDAIIACQRVLKRL